MNFMPFIGLQTFKVKLFFENSLQQYFKSLENKSNSLEPPILAYFFQYDPEEVEVLTNVLF